MSEQLAFIRRKTRTPIIYDVGVGDDGKFPCDRQYTDILLELLRGGIRLGAEYIMGPLGLGDESIRSLVAEKGSTRMIGYFYDHKAPSGGWESEERFETYMKARDLGCDIAQLTLAALRMADNLDVSRFVYRVSQLPEPRPILSAFNSGRLGRTSKWSNAVFTPVYHPTLELRSQSEAAGQITIQEAQQALFHSFVNEKLHFYTIGANITYSLAPALRNAAYRAYGMPHKYFKRQTASLSELDDLLRDEQFGGISISLPYKRMMIDRLQSLSAHARAIGAINTVVPIRTNNSDSNRNNRTFEPSEQHNRGGPILALHGDNTDWIGIRTCVLRYLSPANAITSRTTALVLGAGGMARAAVYAMMCSDVRQILICNRTYLNAVRLADHFNEQEAVAKGSTCDHADKEDETRAKKPSPRVIALRSRDESWPDKYRQPTIIISCLPTPEHNSIASTPSTSDQLDATTEQFIVPTSWMVLELSYRLPLPTAQLRRVHALSDRGWVGISGLEVLPEQAFAQFELWTGRKAPRARMKNAMIRSFLADEQHSHALETPTHVLSTPIGSGTSCKEV